MASVNLWDDTHQNTIHNFCVGVFENEGIVQKDNLNEPKAILIGKQQFCMCL